MNDARAVIVSFTEKQHGVVSRRQLAENGISPRSLRHQIEAGFVEPISEQVLRLVGSPLGDAQTLMAGVLDAPGTAYLSHRSAAAWWGIPGFFPHPIVQVLIPWQGVNRRTRLAELHYHRGLPPDHLTFLKGIPIVSPALLIFLLAGSERWSRTERALDNTLSMNLTTLPTMHALLRRLAKRGRNGIRMMRALLAERPEGYVPPQSGLEARVELLAGDVGVRLRRQVDVGDDDAWIGRVDFELEGSFDVIEVLSARYHSSLSDRRADAERFDRLRKSGRRVLTIWDRDVWSEPDKVREAILEFWRVAMTAGQQRDAPKRD